MFSAVILVRVRTLPPHPSRDERDGRWALDESLPRNPIFREVVSLDGSTSNFQERMFSIRKDPGSYRWWPKS
jgi:hypothetical protein